MSDQSGGLNLVCPKCIDKDAEMFERVKSRLKYGEKVAVNEIANRTGIDRKHIERWVRAGRLGEGLDI